MTVRIEELKKIRDYFLEHDKTTFEHHAYNFLNDLIERESVPAETVVSQAASQAGFACGDLVAVSNIKNFPLSDTTLGLYRMKLGNEHFIDGFSCGYDYCILVKQK